MEDHRQISQDEIREMEKDLSKMEHELLEQYCEVGKGILEKAEMENKRANSLVDQIIETRQRLATAKGERCCPECAEHNGQNSIYCKRCGKKLPKVNEEDNNGTE